MSEKDIEWVTVRAFHDPVKADVAVDFLRDAGLDAMLQGQSGATMMLSSFNNGPDLRVVVPREQVEAAREALDAMEQPDQVALHHDTEQPGEGSAYRGSKAREPDSSFRPRSRIAAPILALFVPIGSGHFYARHGRTGLVLALGIVACVMFAMTARLQWPMTAAMVIVGLDAIASMVAVGRYNEHRVPGAGTQTLLGLGLLVVAVAAGALVGGGM